MKIELESSDALKAACVEYKGDYSFIIVNMGNESQSFSLSGIDKDLKFKKYIYESPGSSPMEADSGAYLKGKILPKSVFLYKFK